MDVHPPLAKLLLTLAGWLAGFDGEFDFKDIGKDYVEPGVPYVAMRMLPAIMGVMTVPMIFLTLKAAGCKTMIATMGAGLLIFGMNPGDDMAAPPNLSPREWSTHSISPDLARLPFDRVHCFHGVGLDMFHKSARAGPLKSFRRQLVVLAGHNRTWPWRYSKCEVGRTFYHRLGGQLDNCPIVGSYWGH